MDQADKFLKKKKYLLKKINEILTWITELQNNLVFY
jgi:hypothetical protein